jgi:hypothetical protein
VAVAQGKGDEEVAVLVLSDLQIGHKTPTTSLRIISNRMERLADRVIKLVSIHRLAFPINRLVIFLLGDMIQSEEVGHKVSLDELEMPLMNQIFQGAVPITEKLLVTLLPHFPAGIDVYTVSGNHGRLDRYHSETTNFDTFIYLVLEQRLREVKGIRWHIEAQRFWQKADIFRHTFLLVHGDQIPMYLNIPFYGVTQRAMRWRGALPGKDFKTLVLGHFHVASDNSWNDMQIFINGCFVSDDQWVLKFIGMESTTRQWLFGVHPRQGISWRYKVRLD